MYRFVIVDGVGSRGAGAVETGSRKPTRYMFSTTLNQKETNHGYTDDYYRENGA